MTAFEKKLLELLWATGKKGGSSPGSEYGVEWDYSNPSPALTRTGDAAGFSAPVPATSLTGAGSSPFDSIMPWAGMRMCNIINGEVVYWQGDPQFSETAYDTMVYIPEFWFKAEKDVDNQKWRWSVSPENKTGYRKHPGSGRYISRYHLSGSSNGVFSKSGPSPLNYTTGADLRTYSHNKGTDWWMLDIATWSAVQMLYLIEFANFNSQDKLGTGCAGSSGVKSMGNSDGAKYHTLKRSGNSNQYRWIEDPFSNIQDFVDGIFIVDHIVYLGTDNAAFSDDADHLTPTGIEVPVDNCISGFGYSTDCPWAFIPDESTADSQMTAYVTDKALRDSGDRVMTTGGYAGGGAIYGFFYFNAAVSLTSAPVSRGSRLIYIP